MTFWYRKSALANQLQAKAGMPPPPLPVHTLSDNNKIEYVVLLPSLSGVDVWSKQVRGDITRLANKLY
jgi:hypothetical protein